MCVCVCVCTNVTGGAPTRPAGPRPLVVCAAPARLGRQPTQKARPTERHSRAPGPRLLPPPACPVPGGALCDGQPLTGGGWGAPFLVISPTWGFPGFHTTFLLASAAKFFCAMCLRERVCTWPPGSAWGAGSGRCQWARRGSSGSSQDLRLRVLAPLNGRDDKKGQGQALKGVA